MLRRQIVPQWSNTSSNPEKLLCDCAHRLHTYYDLSEFWTLKGLVFACYVQDHRRINKSWFIWWYVILFTVIQVFPCYLFMTYLGTADYDCKDGQTRRGKKICGMLIESRWSTTFFFFIYSKQHDGKMSMHAPHLQKNWCLERNGNDDISTLLRQNGCTFKIPFFIFTVRVAIYSKVFVKPPMSPISLHKKSIVLTDVNLVTEVEHQLHDYKVCNTCYCLSTSCHGLLGRQTPWRKSLSSWKKNPQQLMFAEDELQPWMHIWLE